MLSSDPDQVTIYLLHVQRISNFSQKSKYILNVSRETSVINKKNIIYYFNIKFFYNLITANYVPRGTLLSTSFFSIKMKVAFFEKKY